MILTGSRAFFDGLEGFCPHDHDYIKLVDNPKGFNYVRQTHKNGGCFFEWRRMAPEDFINYALNRGPAMQLGKFLTPEFVNEIGFTIEHLEQLRPLRDKLDERHLYQQKIYDAYIENGEFKMTNEQLLEAFDIYKKSRSKESE